MNDCKTKPEHVKAFNQWWNYNDMDLLYGEREEKVAREAWMEAWHQATVLAYSNPAPQVDNTQ